MSDDKTTSADENGTAEGLLHRECGLLSEFQFFVLTPSNTSNAITTPITVGAAPVTQAQLTLRIDDITDRVWLAGTLGWEATGAAGTISTILVKIWRGAIAGTPIFSTRQSKISTGGIDDYVTTSFSHVDFPVIAAPGSTAVTYSLTVEAETAALAIRGPVTLTGAEIERNRICNP